MNKPATAEGAGVVLVRPGVGAVELPAGLTLRELLDRTGAGTIVSVTPRPKAPGAGSLRDAVGAFRGDPKFREIAEAGRAIREEAGEE